MTASTIDQAMILAAGLGTRMRPITDTIPKPLVEVAGKTLLDHALDAVAKAGVGQVTVNVHYLAEQIETHVSGKTTPAIAISDEREELLDSGGGVKHALPLLEKGPLYILNADSFWKDSIDPNLKAMGERWSPALMDMMLLVADRSDAVGFDGNGDFFIDALGKLERRGKAKHAPYVYAGAIICETRLFETISERKFSLNRLFDDAIASGRLFGHRLDGLWLHVGTPDAIGQAEAALLRFAGGHKVIPLKS